MEKVIYKKDENEGFKIRIGAESFGIKSLKGGDEFDPMVEEDGKKLLSKTFASVDEHGEEITEEEYNK